MTENPLQQNSKKYINRACASTYQNLNEAYSDRTSTSARDKNLNNNTSQNNKFCQMTSWNF